MDLQIFEVGPFAANCSIVTIGATTIIIDPGANAEDILSTLDGLTPPSAILLTHGHLDHISALPGILKKYPATPVYLHDGDAAWCFTNTNLFPPYNTIPPKPQTLKSLNEGTLKVGEITAEILHTPGHSPGSVSIKIEDTLFTGDTLFLGSIGRTDLYGGSATEISKSLNAIKRFPDDTIIVPGHGPSSRISYEKLNNPFLCP